MKKSVIAENYELPGSGKYSVHAEHAVLNKYMAIRGASRKVDLLVIRLSPSGVLGSSRPCRDCLKRMTLVSKKYGLCIKNVYYSTSKGTIECEKFRTMLDSPLTYTSSGHDHCRKNHRKSNVR